MNLATRCPSCGTVFRVVQDQLRVSEGWVRCGRCNGVFNAAEVLFDIDTGNPLQIDLGLPAVAAGAADTEPRPEPPRFEAPPPAAASAPTWAGSRQEPGFDSAPAWAPPGPAEPDFAAADGADAAPPRPEEPMLRTPSRQADEAASDSANDAADDRIVVTDHVPGEPVLATLAAMGAPAVPAPSPVQAVPSFLRHAERSRVWRRPAVRAALAAGVALLAVALLAQLALVWRDTLAARLPGTEPALRALCRVAGCSVQPLRRIEMLAVHSSGLNRLEGSSLYRLQVVLHNRADTAVMMPALELALTDAQGKLVARRVLQAGELGAPQAALQAGEELPVKALVSTGERRVDGYTLELFYP
jgi:predicted Zn finger-like uncharacterized protein